MESDSIPLNSLLTFSPAGVLFRTGACSRAIKCRLPWQATDVSPGLIERIFHADEFLSSLSHEFPAGVQKSFSALLSLPCGKPGRETSPTRQLPYPTENSRQPATHVDDFSLSGCWWEMRMRPTRATIRENLPTVRILRAVSGLRVAAFQRPVCR